MGLIDDINKLVAVHLGAPISNRLTYDLTLDLTYLTEQAYKEYRVVHKPDVSVQRNWVGPRSIDITFDGMSVEEWCAEYETQEIMVTKYQPTSGGIITVRTAATGEEASVDVERPLTGDIKFYFGSTETFTRVPIHHNPDPAKAQIKLPPPEPTEEQIREYCGVWVDNDKTFRVTVDDLREKGWESYDSLIVHDWAWRLEPIPESEIPKKEPPRERYQVKYPLLAGILED